MTSSALYGGVTTLRVDAFTEKAPPTDSRILDCFPSYKWVPLSIPGTAGKASNPVRIYVVEVPSVAHFVLKRIGLCRSTNTALAYELKTVLNKEMEGLKSLGRVVGSLIPEIVDFRLYRDSVETFSCADILFRLPGRSFATIAKELKESPKMAVVNELIAFLGRLEQINAPYGLLLEHNVLVVGGRDRITVIGLGLVEAAILYGEETSRSIREKNVKEVIEYIKVVDPLAVPQVKVNSVGELNGLVCGTVSYESSPKVLSTEKYAVREEPRFDMIKEEAFEHNWLYRSSKTQEKIYFFTRKHMVLLICLAAVFLGLVATTVYFSVKYYKTNRDHNALEDFIKESSWPSQELETLVSNSWGRRLGSGGSKKVKDLIDAMSDFLNLVYMLISRYKVIESYKTLYPELAKAAEQCEEDNKDLKAENDKIKLENIFDNNEYEIKGNMESSYVYRLTEGMDFFKKEDGGHVILATYFHMMANQRWLGSILLNVDQKGRILSHALFEATDVRKFHAAISCRDGGVAMAGFVIPDYFIYTDDLWVIKLDSSWKQEWSFLYPHGTDGAHDLIEANDGAIISVGSDGLDPWSSRIWIAKINHGAMIWQYVGSQSITDMHSTDAKAIIRSSRTGNYMVVGYETYQAILIIITDDGLHLGDYRFDYNIYLQDIAELEGGDVVTVGTNTAQVGDMAMTTRVYRLTPNGAKVLHLDLVDSVNYFYSYSGYAIEALPGGGFVVGGKRCRQNQFQTSWICENFIMGFDDRSNTAWESNFSGGTVKRIKYENGKLVILEDQNSLVALVTMKIPGT